MAASIRVNEVRFISGGAPSPKLPFLVISVDPGTNASESTRVQQEHGACQSRAGMHPHKTIEVNSLGNECGKHGMGTEQIALQIVEILYCFFEPDYRPRPGLAWGRSDWGDSDSGTEEKCSTTESTGFTGSHRGRQRLSQSLPGLQPVRYCAIFFHTLETARPRTGEVT